MRRSSHTRPPSGNMMTPLRVSNRDNIQTSNAGARRSSSTTRTSTGASCGAAPVKRPRVQKVGPPAQAPRRSSIFGNGRQETGPTKDPRPLGDRNYRERSIRKIVEFLTAEGYPNKITTRTLSTPNTKDVVNIYNFLFQYTDPEYTNKGKPEEEIPRMLALLQYPLQLSRNHMFTVAAQHSWPHVLGGLVWLVDTILNIIGEICRIMVTLIVFDLWFESGTMSYMRNIDVMDVMFPRGDDFNESEKEILSMHLATAYQHYLSGVDDFTPHEERLQQKMKERWQQNGNTVEKLQEKQRRLKEQLEEMRNDPDTLEARLERVAMLQTDIESHTRYVQQMTSLNDQLIKQLHVKEQLKESQNAELEKLAQEHEKKQEIIDAQGISVSDVMRMNAQKQELVAQIRVLEEQNAQLNDQVCNAEIEYSRKRETGDARCCDVNNLARKCYGSENSDKVYLERGVNTHAYKTSFEKIAQEVRLRVQRTETDRDKLKYKSEMANEREDDLHKDLQVKQFANKTQADEYARFMKCEREEMDKMQAVLEDLQQQIDVVMAAMATGDDVDRAVDKVMMDCEARVKSAVANTHQYADFLHKVVALAADHKLKMKEIFTKVESLPKDPELQPFRRA